MGVRKNQTKLTSAEWQAFTGAVSALHGVNAAKPRYREFVKVHVQAMTTATGMTWSVHTMQGMGMVGKNFLAWHRWFLLRLEKRLQQVDASVTIPYWDPIKNPQIPGPLTDPQLLNSWSVDRGTWDPSQLPIAADLTAVKSRTTFTAFQSRLEGMHAGVHNAVGGDMAGAASPTDPLFWLHHSNIDRIWSEWQKKHPSAKPPNVGDTLKPTPLFGVKVSSVLSISTLGYSYS
jgi:tyrosinase